MEYKEGNFNKMFDKSNLVSFRVSHQTNNKASNSGTKEDKSTKFKALAGATIGTALPLGILMRGRNTKNPLKFEYGLKDMLVLSGGGIGGGTIGGMMGGDKKARKSKFKEGTFQFLNALFPTVLVACGLKLSGRQEQLNSNVFRVTSIILGIAAGMYGALKLSNFMFDPKDKEPDRKLSLKDCLASADEAVGALALAKFPVVTALNLDKCLPLIYGYCGYRAGSARE